MNLDECTVYVFVRQDLPIEQQLVQAAHALFRSCQPDYSPCTSMASGAIWQNPEPITITVSGPSTGHPNIIFVGMPNLKALKRVEHKLIAHNIKHSSFVEPDFDLGGISSIATWPLTVEEKEVLSNYRLWRYVPGAEKSAGLNAEPGANALVAQDVESSALKAVDKEHSVFNGEVAGPEPGQELQNFS